MAFVGTSIRSRIRVAVLAAAGGVVGTACADDGPALWKLDGTLTVQAGQTARAWVYFSDKGFHDAASRERALAELAASYDPHATARRAQRRTAPGLFDERDLPVATGYVAAVESTGARVRQRSRWLNAVSVDVPAAQLGALSAIPAVERISSVRQASRGGMEETEGAATRHVNRDFYGASSAQLNQIGVPALHSAGYTGSGVVIGILDSGWILTHNAFNQPGHVVKVLASYDFVNNDPNVGIQAGDHPDQHRHGTWILGCIGSYLPGTLVGGAFDASFVLAKTEDVAAEYPHEEDNWVAGLEFVEAHGADVVTSSLGYIDWYTQGDLDGRTAVTSKASLIAAENGVHLTNAAGNEGHDADPLTSHLIAPADGIKVITCGAADISGAIASFSSDGPTADGRVKPEVLACGYNTQTVSSRSDTDLGVVSGTSLSTPLVASAVACLTQAHPNWSVDQMREAILRTSAYFTAHQTFDPQYVLGYGMLDAAAALSAHPCMADFNGDWFVDVYDFTDFVNCFEGVACPPGRSADFNGDGFADIYDFTDFVTSFETGC